MKATKRDMIALAVAIVLFVLVFIYAVKTLPTVESKLDGQGGQQSDIKTVADEWPMKPPVIISMSNWDPTGNRRWVKVGGYLAIECRTSPGFSSVSFVPETATTATMPK